MEWLEITLLQLQPFCSIRFLSRCEDVIQDINAIRTAVAVSKRLHIFE